MNLALFNCLFFFLEELNYAEVLWGQLSVLMPVTSFVFCIWHPPTRCSILVVTWLLLLPSVLGGAGFLATWYLKWLWQSMFGQQ